MTLRINNLRELFSAKEIETRVCELAARINDDYRGKNMVALCVLNGAFMFFADLVRRFDMGPELDFLRLSSYGGNSLSSGRVLFSKDTELSLEGKHVLIVEDIVDTGVTMNFLLREIGSRNVKSLRIAALIDKVERRTEKLTVDYAGFTVNWGFIVGYGLDYAGRFRELPGIHVAELDVGSGS